MRPLKSHESELLICLMKEAGMEANIEALLVEEMKDGGMGSLKFFNSNHADRRMVERKADKIFKDDDGVEILVSLNMNQYGEIFELDIWKVDFSPVIKYPKCE